MNRTSLVSTLAGLMILAAGAASAREAKTANLAVTFTGITKTTGAIMMAMFDSQAAYEGDDAKPIRVAVVPAGSAEVSTAFEGLAPGHYAIKLYHDVNGDGKMNTNPFGMPTEPYAFSNNAKGNMGPAKWPDAMFNLDIGENKQSITID